MKPPRVLFGGTFDPVHRAHISCARAVSRALAGATVELMPNAVPPHRAQPGADARHRLAMLRIATEGVAGLAVNDFELSLDGPSWTHQTLSHYRAEQGNAPLVLVIGADSLASFTGWRDWQDFPRLCHLAVVPRPGTAPADPSVLAAFPEADAATLLGSAAGKRLMLSGPSLDVSATAVREALATRGHCPALAGAVQAYIHAHGLYNVPQADNGDTPKPMDTDAAHD